MCLTAYFMMFYGMPDKTKGAPGRKYVFIVFYNYSRWYRVIFGVFEPCSEIGTKWSYALHLGRQTVVVCSLLGSKLSIL